MPVSMDQARHAAKQLERELQAHAEEIGAILADDSERPDGYQGRHRRSE